MEACFGASRLLAILLVVRRSCSPDDAFFSPDGRRIVVTQEDDFVISVVDRASDRIVFRYGHPGVPGSEPGYVHNPDDAMLMPSGDLLSADIKNCRVLVVRPPAHRPLRQLGETGICEHDLGVSYGSPNGAFRWLTVTRLSRRSTATGWM